MDPNATLKAISEAVADGFLEDAAQLSFDLRRWISSGGFEPQWWDYPEAQAFYSRPRAAAADILRRLSREAGQMIAIRTRFNGPIDTTGSRITATTYANGRRQTARLPYPYERSSGEPAHRPAAEALAARLGLELTSFFAEEPATSPRGYVFLAARKEFS